MPHITPEQIVEAYKVTGIRPVTKEWGCVIDLGRCGCPLTALATQHGFDWDEYVCDSDDEEVIRFLADKLELDWSYLNGFYRGVDAAIIESWFNAQYPGVDWLYFQEGYKHGSEAWGAVTKETGIYQ